MWIWLLRLLQMAKFWRINKDFLPATVYYCRLFYFFIFTFVNFEVEASDFFFFFHFQTSYMYCKIKGKVWYDDSWDGGCLINKFLYILNWEWSHWIGVRNLSIQIKWIQFIYIYKYVSVCLYLQNEKVFLNPRIHEKKIIK